MKILRYCLSGIGLASIFLFFLPMSVAQEYSWSAVYSLIESRFPNTPTVNIDVLEDWKKSEDILLVDVREEEEYRVSHLRGAKNWKSMEDFQHIRKDKRIVLYCSVGYRSAKLVQALQRIGYTQVYNLKGSIFAWTNAGKPVFQAEKQAASVHPYNELWGNLLDKKYHPFPAGQER